MLELAILGLLKEGSMHGYQLKKRLAETLGSFWQVSYGSLYPALKRLQRDGAVEMTFPQEDVARRKNVYRITPLGEDAFRELLERAGHEATQDNGFSVRLAFFQYLKPETRIRLLERRRSFLEGRGSDLQRSLQSYKERIDGYTLSLMNHQLASTEADIRWVDDLIQVEQREVRKARAPRGARPARDARSRSRGTIPQAEPPQPITTDIGSEKERA
jgi:DNA-binding PadR family transcriptional regulator